MSQLETFYVLLIVALWETSEIVSESGGGFNIIAYVSAGLFFRSKNFASCESNGFDGGACSLFLL